jgi:hypothetical protein
MPPRAASGRLPRAPRSFMAEIGKPVARCEVQLSERIAKANNRPVAHLTGERPSLLQADLGATATTRRLHGRPCGYKCGQPYQPEEARCVRHARHRTGIGTHAAIRPASVRRRLASRFGRCFCRLCADVLSEELVRQPTAVESAVRAWPRHVDLDRATCRADSAR